jgi:hypothetical protein
MSCLVYDTTTTRFRAKSTRAERAQRKPDYKGTAGDDSIHSVGA